MHYQSELCSYIGSELYLLLLLALMLGHSVSVLNQSHQYRHHRRVLYFVFLFLGIDALHYYIGHSPFFLRHTTAVGLLKCMCYVWYLLCVLILFLQMYQNSVFSARSTERFTVLFGLFLFSGIPAQTALPGRPVLSSFIVCASLTLCLSMDRRLISRDPLTRLNNRSEMTRYMEQRLRQTGRKQPLYLVLLDLDEFKKVNDTYGHTVGDQALILFADTLRRLSISHDGAAFLSRYGGDEFLIVLEADEDADIDRLLLRLSKQLEQSVETVFSISGLTVSFGYARLEPEDSGITLADLIAQADRQMYQQKKSP